MTFTYRPPSFITLPDDQLRTQLNQAIPRIYDAHAALDATAIKAPTTGAGFAVLAGTTTVTGSKLGISTGLATVATVVVSINNGATATNFTVTARVTPSNTAQIDIFCWQPTASGNNTPIACTTPLAVNWWVTGESTS